MSPFVREVVAVVLAIWIADGAMGFVKLFIPPRYAEGEDD